MLWQDPNGKLWQGGPLIANGRQIFNPRPEHFLAAGYTEYTPPPPSAQPPEPSPQEVDFNKVKASFWSYVDAAAEELTAATGQTFTRADFPANAYSSELLAWCADHDLDAEMTNKLALGFCGIDADLRRLGRSWEELFMGDEMYQNNQPEQAPEQVNE